MAKDDPVLDELKVLKKRLRELVKKWVPVMGLRWWHVDINYIYEVDHMPGGDYVGAARTRAAWQYKEAVVDFCMPKLLGLSYEDLENVVVHEFVHILTDPMMYATKNRLYQEHVELSTTFLAEAFLWVRDEAAKGNLNLPD